MTVDGLREWLDDGDLFVDDNQEVLFSYNGKVLEIDGTCVPESGPVKVLLRPANDPEGKTDNERRWRRQMARPSAQGEDA